MLDWLKVILGEQYSDEIDKKVSEQIGKDFVSRADFNTLNAEKKTLTDTVAARDAQLEQLKSSAGNTESLAAEIARLQQENKDAAAAHEAELTKLKVDNAVELALAAAKAKNIKAVKALLDLEKAELDKDGQVKGLTEQIKKLAEDKDSSFLFEPKEGKKKDLQGLNPSEGGDGKPAGAKEPKDMSYNELVAYLDANPNAKL